MEITLELPSLVSGQTLIIIKIVEVYCNHYLYLIYEQNLCVYYQCVIQKDAFMKGICQVSFLLLYYQDGRDPVIPYIKLQRE